MKKLTNQKKRILMQSLPVAILAAIAFISIPSVLPESETAMKESVALIECKQIYEITKRGKTIGVCSGMRNDSTLSLVKEKADSDVEKKVLVCGAWTNRYSLFPSCGGRIISVDPFFSNNDMLDFANKKIVRIIEKTMEATHGALKTSEAKQAELDYYLDTHNVKDEGYNTMAEYADQNKRKRTSLEHSIELLKSLLDGKEIRIRKKTTFTLLYRDDSKRESRKTCSIDTEESKSHDKGIIILRTADGFMPEESNSVYPCMFDMAPKKGDSVCAAAVFGLSLRDGTGHATIKANLFMGVATSEKSHDIPHLLAPDGAPIFNRKGYFVGISNKGRIAK